MSRWMAVAAMMATLALVPAGSGAGPLTFQGGVAASRVDQQGHQVPPRGPMVSEMSEDLTPEIPGPETVIRLYEDAGGTQVREFVINGRVFQIEVTPRGGAPYLLMDTDGDGIYEESFYGREPKLVVPQWVLFTF